MTGDPALSNPKGLVNLGRIVEPDSGRRRLDSDSICVLAASPRRSHISGIDPAEGSDRTGAASENLWEFLEKVLPGCCPVSRGDVERLCHAAINLQIRWVGASRCCRIRGPNEQRRESDRWPRRPGYLRDRQGQAEDQAP